MTDLEALRERVREATGPDRDLDLALATALVPDVLVLRQRPDDSGADPYTYWEYTASLDAALGLVERMLPKVEMELHFNKPGRDWQTALIRSSPLTMQGGECETMPLAVLSALLSAIAQKVEG